MSTDWKFSTTVTSTASDTRQKTQGQQQKCKWNDKHSQLSRLGSRENFPFCRSCEEKSWSTPASKSSCKTGKSKWIEENFVLASNQHSKDRMPKPNLSLKVPMSNEALQVQQCQKDEMENDFTMSQQCNWAAFWQKDKNNNVTTFAGRNS